MYAALDIAAALNSSSVIGVVLIVGLIRPETICEILSCSGGAIAGTNVTATLGRFGTGGIAGRDDGVGFIPGIVRLDGASSRLKRRK